MKHELPESKQHRGSQFGQQLKVLAKKLDLINSFITAVLLREMLDCLEKTMRETDLKKTTLHALFSVMQAKKASML